MAAQYYGQCFYQVPIDYFIQKARMIGQAGLKIRYVLDQPTPNGAFIRMSKDMSWASWGENIDITLIAMQNGTQVNIHSECSVPTTLVDFGANQKNVDKIFKYFEQGMPGR